MLKRSRAEGLFRAERTDRAIRCDSDSFRLTCKKARCYLRGSSELVRICMLLIDQDIRLTPPIGLGSVRLIDQRKRTRNVPTREHQTMKRRLATSLFICLFQL